MSTKRSLLLCIRRTWQHARVLKWRKIKILRLITCTQLHCLNLYEEKNSNNWSTAVSSIQEFLAKKCFVGNYAIDVTAVLKPSHLHFHSLRRSRFLSILWKFKCKNEKDSVLVLFYRLSQNSYFLFILYFPTLPKWKHTVFCFFLLFLVSLRMHIKIRIVTDAVML